MNINLSPEQVEAISNDLKTRKVSHFKYNEQDFYVRLDQVKFNEKDSLVNHLINLEENASAVAEGIQSELGQHFIFATIARNKFKEIFETGKMISVYFFSNSRYDTPFPHELIEPNECDVRVLINSDK